MNAKNFGLAMTSLPSIRPPARTYVRTQSKKTNVPEFVWREVAWQNAFTTEMLMNTKYKVNLYVFVGYVDKHEKKRRRQKENKKAETIKQCST